MLNIRMSYVHECTYVYECVHVYTIMSCMHEKNKSCKCNDPM